MSDERERTPIGLPRQPSRATRDTVEEVRVVEKDLAVFRAEVTQRLDNGTKTMEELRAADRAIAEAARVAELAASGRRPTTIAVLALVFAVGGQVAGYLVDAGRLATAADLSDLRSWAELRDERAATRIAELEREVAAGRARGEAIQAVLDVVSKAGSRDAAQSRKR